MKKSTRIMALIMLCNYLMGPSFRLMDRQFSRVFTEETVRLLMTRPSLIEFVVSTRRFGVEFVFQLSL